MVLGAAGGDLDSIGPTTVPARPPGSEAVWLDRTSLVSAVEEVLAEDHAHPLGRNHEERVRRLAIEGSTSPRRKLIDAYSDFASVFALRVRPESTSEAAAVTQLNKSWRASSPSRPGVPSWPPSPTG